MSSKNTRTSKSYKVRVGITLGDPSGIGPEIILAALGRLKAEADFTVVGDNWVLGLAAAGRRFQAEGIKFIDLNNVGRKNFSFGKIKAEYGRASLEYLDEALGLIKSGKIDCLVTCPVSKEAVNSAGFSFPGQTEYFARRSGTDDFVMLLLNKDLKISLVTRHIPLKDVPAAISADKIRKTVLLTYRALKDLFLIREPRIVVCGLNPHASDNGVIGAEELKVIRPALSGLKRKLRHLAGPLSADVAVYKARQEEYDAVIAMYHDQALIPLKLRGKKTGVNMTIGLPFIRTSPLHGTAFDIAGKRLADPFSFIEAVKTAIICSRNQKKA